MGAYMIRGIGTSKGIGMGRALIVESPQMEISVKKIQDTAAEQERYKKAKAQFIEETQQMIEQLKQRLGEKDKTALILHNQIYLINDAEMDNGILQMIQEQKVCAEAAVEETCNLYIKINRVNVIFINKPDKCFVYIHKIEILSRYINRYVILVFSLFLPFSKLLSCFIPHISVKLIYKACLFKNINKYCRAFVT